MYYMTVDGVRQRGVILQAARLIRECRGGAFRRREGMFLAAT